MKREADATKRVRGSRRRHDAAFKREVVSKTLAPGASVAAIALENRLNTNLLFKWRRDHLRAQGRLATARPSTMLPVMVATASNEALGSRPRSAPGLIEIELPAGRIRIRGGVDADSLRVVIDVLLRR